MLIDIHAHLDHCKKDIREIIDNAKKADIKIIVANGINKESNRKTVEFSKKYGIVKPALGIYPIDSIKMGEQDFKAELDFIEKQKIVKKADVNHLFCETDSPYLSPFRGKENEPAFVVEGYRKIAEIKGMDFNEVVNNVWMNYENVFK